MLKLVCKVQLTVHNLSAAPHCGDHDALRFLAWGLLRRELFLFDDGVAAACALAGGRTDTKDKVTLVERSSAPPIDEHGICRRLGLFVDEQDARALGSEVPVAPGEHRHDDRAKIAAHLGEHIFGARRPFAVAAALQETGINQGAQAAGQHVGRDGQALLEFVKAREPVQSVANNQDTPPLADALKAASNGTGHLAKTFTLHRDNVLQSLS